MNEDHQIHKSDFILRRFKKTEQCGESGEAKTQVSDVGILDTGLHCGSVEEVMKSEWSEVTGCEEKGRCQASCHYWHLKPTVLVA